jgi:hypothetical protein
MDKSLLRVPCWRNFQGASSSQALRKPAFTCSLCVASQPPDSVCSMLPDCFASMPVPFCVRKQCTGALTLPARRQEDRLDSRSAPADNTPQRLQPEEPAMRLRC